jgi:hypothetical protein
MRVFGRSSPVRTLAVWFLLLQAIAVAAWWGVILLSPPARQPFLGPGAPDANLLAFFAGDLLFYVGGSLLAAYGLALGRSWAWPVLCVHAGAVVYAALYTLSLPTLSGEGWLGAALMLPSLVVLPILVWQLRPQSLR